MTGEETRHNKAESIRKLLEKYDIKKAEFYYIRDAATDVTACREAGVTCLSAAWSDSADVESLKKQSGLLVLLCFQPKGILESLQYQC